MRKAELSRYLSLELVRSSQGMPAHGYKKHGLTGHFACGFVSQPLALSGTVSKVLRCFWGSYGHDAALSSLNERSTVASLSRQRPMGSLLAIGTPPKGAPGADLLYRPAKRRHIRPVITIVHYDHKPKTRKGQATRGVSVRPDRKRPQAEAPPLWRDTGRRAG
jgi:hypothetical protein